MNVYDEDEVNNTINVPKGAQESIKYLNALHWRKSNRNSRH